jgi:hypothetical protein
MVHTIVPADKNHRRRILLLYGLFVCLGGITIRFGFPWAERFIGQQDPETAFRIIRIALFVVFISLAAPGLYLARLGRRIMEAERFPLPGQKVVRDTVLLEGGQARIRGRLLVFLALLLLLAGLFGAFYSQHLLDGLSGCRKTQQITNGGEAP